MSAITRIRAWSNPGFTEDGPEAPHYGYTLPSPSEDLRNLDYEPSTSRMFSEFKIADAVWESWRGMSFLEVTYSWNNSLSNTVLYGFVDEVELLSDTAGAAAVRVRWHVDEWMTYLGSASLGFGHVLRRPVGAADPIQSYERKYWEQSYHYTLLDTVKINNVRTYWVLLAVGEVVGSDRIVRYYTFPFWKNGNTIFIRAGGVGVSAPTYAQVTAGLWDECLDLDPAGIYGAWVLPVCPFNPNDMTTSGNEITAMSGSSGWELKATPGTCASIVSKTTAKYSDLFYEKSMSWAGAPTATELNPLRVTGFTGETIGDFPIGMSPTSYTYRIVASATECYVELRFVYGWYSRLEGTCFTVPALVLDLTENAWSSYQYSGQREYDITARNNESLKSGIQGIASGGMTGALMGGFGPMGAAAGAVGGVIGGAASMGMDFLWYNQAAQGAKDKLAAQQTPGILISGGALDAVENGYDIAMCVMEMDAYSAGRASDERSLVGVKVDEYNSSNDTVRASTGFYQIVNLAVTGSIPNSAKRSIANRFAKGVKLI
jgi:hypothetical protein